MRQVRLWRLAVMMAASGVLGGLTAHGQEAVLPPVTKRFAAEDVTEVPSFQRHVSPLFGRLGCNGRACHGSFQGRGGFQLSLFGYDFAADHKALLDQESPRIDLEKPLESLILTKPTDADLHEGGKRYDKGGWEYHLFRRWLEAGGQYAADHVDKLARLEITPSEVVFEQADRELPLRVVAVWEDGSREDVTPLCRFQSNDDLVAKIDENGLLTSGEAGDTHVVVFYDKAVVPVPVMRPVSSEAGVNYPQVAAPTRIDELVVNKLRKLGVVPSDQCSDSEFLRRVSLDLTGTLPSAAAVESFLQDSSPDKRARKIDELLETPAYAAWWTTKLCDFTGNNDQQLTNVTPVRSRASQEWYDWIRTRVSANVPYDELVAGIVTATSRQPGQNYRQYCEMMSDVYRDGSERSFEDMESMPYYWARRDFRQPEERAISFAYAFLGIRIQCAQCHKHPFDVWSKEDFEQFKGFFAGVQLGNNGAPDARKEYAAMVEALGLEGKRGGELRRELPKLLNDGKVVPFPEVYTVKARTPAPRGKNAKRNNNRGRGNLPPATARLLGGDEIDLTQYDDVRVPLMEWLRDPNNPLFARAFANRVWASYFNVGIVEPPDDLSLANPPSNAELLNYLSEQFVAHQYDMKWLHREILNSAAYQRSWRPNATNAQDKRNFSRAVPRRIPAEVAYDAVQQAANSDERAEKWLSELDGRAIALASTRQQGGRGPDYALTIFGRSTRESNCDCDRANDPTLLQTVYLQNDADFLAMLDRRGTSWIDQLARELGKPRADAALNGGNGDRQLANLERTLKQTTARIRQLKKQDGRDKQIAQLQKRVEQLKRRYAALSGNAQPADQSADQPEGTARPSAKPAEQFDAKLAEKLVEQAFLRTLSRFPNESERVRSVAFLRDADDEVAGARGLLWALINTKEFIVNH